MTEYSKLPEEYPELLEELECPICTAYLRLPIMQCETGHSVCGKCRDRLENCALCRKPFTGNRNFSLEGVALKMLYPCINKDSGCELLLSYGDIEEHEKTCGVQSLLIPCQMKSCNFTGYPEALKIHWNSKENSSRIYGAYNKCNTKIRARSYYVNLVEAFGQLFWFKTMLHNENLYFAMQYIGAAENAHKYFYQIEISHPILYKKKIIVSDYCKSMTLTNEQLFQDDICIVFLLSSLRQFFENGENPEMGYIMRVFKVNGRQRQRRQNFHNSKNRNTNRNNYRQPPQQMGVQGNHTDYPNAAITEEANPECCVIL